MWLRRERAFASVLPAALNSTSSPRHPSSLPLPPPPGPGRKFTATRTTLLNSARPAPLPRTTIAAIAHNFQNSAHKTFRETTALALGHPLAFSITEFRDRVFNPFASILRPDPLSSVELRIHDENTALISPVLFYPSPSRRMDRFESFREFLKMESLFVLFSKKREERKKKEKEWELPRA